MQLYFKLELKNIIEVNFQKESSSNSEFHTDETEFLETLHHDEKSSKEHESSPLDFV